mmetsp:Transcript_28742/g.34917  ORF Transcript_28742/g.34917 Transcript_28742/m.34917 type:complete len:406 (-) Transcript_28742:130-1347(-)
MSSPPESPARRNITCQTVASSGPLLTTVIGSYPKPGYLKIPDWFTNSKDWKERDAKNYDFKTWEKFMEKEDQGKFQYDVLRATNEVISAQDLAGIDIMTDGEIRRENYIHYHLRNVDGMDFDNLTEHWSRNKGYKFLAPTVRSKIKPRSKAYSTFEWKTSQLFTNKTVKFTIPGPVTIRDTVADVYYGEERKLEYLEDLAATINQEILDLVKHGCKCVQVDEPVFARYPSETLEYGLDILKKCFRNVPDTVERCVHICCGYPLKLDQLDYPKAEIQAYHKIAKAIDDADFIDAVSLEDAHRFNELNLFGMFKKTKIILGLVHVSSTKIETQEQIEKRIEDVLTQIPPERLLIAPDCGLAMLPLHMITSKLQAMVNATQAVNQRLLKKRKNEESPAAAKSAKGKKK